MEAVEGRDGGSSPFAPLGRKKESRRLYATCCVRCDVLCATQLGTAACRRRRGGSRRVGTSTAARTRRLAPVRPQQRAHVCLSVRPRAYPRNYIGVRDHSSPSVCLSVREHISKTTRPRPQQRAPVERDTAPARHAGDLGRAERH